MSGIEISRDMTEQLATSPTTNGTKKPRKQRENVTKFTGSVTVSVTEAMVQSLIRMCPINGPINQSTYLRLLLHRGLMADDPAYAAAIGGNHA
jgi:hypothetical protein